MKLLSNRQYTFLVVLTYMAVVAALATFLHCRQKLRVLLEDTVPHQPMEMDSGSR